jgi:hypothetical protein
MSLSEILTSSVAFVIIFFVLILGLRSGIKRIRKEKIIEIIPFSEKLEIYLSGQIGFKDYRNLIFGQTYKRPFYIIFSGLLIVFLLTFLPNNSKLSNQSFYYLYIFLGIFIVSPIFTLFRIKELYKTNKIFHEQLDYYINNDFIRIKGETIDSTQKWNRFYKIKETKDFFMLYNSNLAATLIDKKMFKDNEINDFKRFIRSLRLIK